MGWQSPRQLWAVRQRSWMMGARGSFLRGAMGQLLPRRVLRLINDPEKRARIRVAGAREVRENGFGPESSKRCVASMRNSYRVRAPSVPPRPTAILRGLEVAA